MNILFVCHGNICRSPMAEFLLRDLLRRAGRTDITVGSAALHDDEIGHDTHPRTRAVLREHDIPFAPRAAWRLTADKAREYDLILGMDAENMADLHRLLGATPAPTVRPLLSYVGLTRDVADPWYTGDYAATWADISLACEALLRTL